MPKPLLSIGMIFKNEIRCLERCMKSLAPLREAVSSELVMADTGSDDGSREIAEKYADIFFDFPWINDFSAARNAVIDRCSGEWYLSIDADEWLDGDISQLTEFLTRPERWGDRLLCGMMLRNYLSPDLKGERNEFLAVRLARISSGTRFAGAIHELWDCAGDMSVLERMMIHHDGYAYYDSEAGKKKLERNMLLLRKKLAAHPDDLKAMLQCLESSIRSPSYDWYIRQAVSGVERKLNLWQFYGPSIFRYAVLWAAGQKLPELEEWFARAEELFPDSMFTNIDIAFAMFITRAEERKYAEAVPLGERYLRSVEAYRSREFNYGELVVGAFSMSAPVREEEARIVLADVYFQEKQFQDARKMLLSIDQGRMQAKTAGSYMSVLLNLHAQCGEDMSPVMADLWEKAAPEKERDELRRKIIGVSAIAFSQTHRDAEDENGFNHAYTVFLPLAGRCGLGTAAAILESRDPAEMGKLLEMADNWDEFPIAALERALLAGVKFPQAARPLTLETMDSLASRLARSGGDLSGIFEKAVDAMGRNSQSLAWARGLALAAAQFCPWQDEEKGLKLAGAFAKVEREFLPRYYAAELLCEENVRLLPPMHRFGWYCSQAFDALDRGETVPYVQLLKKGLDACPGMKDMVEFLTDHTPELQTPKPSGELLELAEKVRVMLSAYAPDDPAVMMIKQSPAYQKVATLIEGPGMALAGGLKQ